MCIMICDIGHPQFPLVLGSNRDEFLARPTQPAGFVTPDIVMPLDLHREEHGTWIGVNKGTGKICVLVNYRENMYPNQMGPISRGGITKSYLNSELDPEIWATLLKEETNNFENVGGFTLFFGVIRPGVDLRESLYVISNREDGIIRPFTNTSRDVFGLSNSSVFYPWPKVVQGEALMEELNTVSSLSATQVAHKVFDIMSTATPREVADANDDERYMEKTIFVPLEAPRDANKGQENYGESRLYGTRTQTVLLVSKEGSDYRLEYWERECVDGLSLILPPPPSQPTLSFVITA